MNCILKFILLFFGVISTQGISQHQSTEDFKLTHILHKVDDAVKDLYLRAFSYTDCKTDVFGYLLWASNKKGSCRHASENDADIFQQSVCKTILPIITNKTLVVRNQLPVNCVRK
ncbi:uncharacterized protein LOC124363232 [Homalodisca vitripennis]|uniref:uncharacterized protein LOC124363232 n=1 Tax=Homalodisca vitripennis TaxID=197043 RepID=UPI001EEA48F0|nr:uncharacterized protein LOC124363232 [Homalodisca vitripennis]